MFTRCVKNRKGRICNIIKEGNAKKVVRSILKEVGETLISVGSEKLKSTDRNKSKIGGYMGKRG